tara:strand:+ start:1159 stop:2706 length:1548 start_codon:yes stop_codon:yes gene_type:complete
MADLLQPTVNWAAQVTVDADDINLVQREVSAAFDKLGEAHPEFHQGVGGTFSVGTAVVPQDAVNTLTYDLSVGIEFQNRLDAIIIRVQAQEPAGPSATFSLKTTIVVPWENALVGTEVAVDKVYGNSVAVQMGGSNAAIGNGGLNTGSHYKFYNRGGGAHSSNDFVYDAAWDIGTREIYYDYSYPTLSGGVFACLQINTLYQGYYPRQVAMMAWGRNSGYVPKQPEGGLIASVAPASRQYPKGCKLSSDSSYGAFGYYNYGGSKNMLHIDLFQDNGGSGAFNLVDSYSDARIAAYGNNYGSEVMAIDPSGTWIVCGTPFARGGAAMDGDAQAGYIMVLRRSSTQLLLSGYFNDPTGGANDYFGSSVDFVDESEFLVMNRRGETISFWYDDDDGEWVQGSKSAPLGTFTYQNSYQKSGATLDDSIFPYSHYYETGPGQLFQGNANNPVVVIDSPVAPDGDSGTRWTPWGGFDIASGIYGDAYAVVWGHMDVSASSLSQDRAEVGSDTYIQIYDKTS